MWILAINSKDKQIESTNGEIRDIDEANKWIKREFSKNWNIYHV